jgi:hypothetical protein
MVEFLLKVFVAVSIINRSASITASSFTSRYQQTIVEHIIKGQNNNTEGRGRRGEFLLLPDLLLLLLGELLRFVNAGHAEVGNLGLRDAALFGFFLRLFGWRLVAFLLDGGSETRDGLVEWAVE